MKQTRQEKLIEEKTKELVRIKKRRRLLKYRGSGIWKGNLEEMRESRV